MKELATQAIQLVHERIINSVPDFDGRAVLLFSGGRDSSAVAAAFCKAFPASQLHLLLIDNGLLSRLDSTKRQLRIIQDLNPGNDIIFEMKRVSMMMRQVGMQQIEADFRERSFSTLLICLACKLIMNYSAARYAQELGIHLILDGYAERQKDYPEQTDEFMVPLKKIYADFGLTYLSPLYDILADKPVVNQMLAELGVYIPKQEPVCMWSDSFSTAKPEEITRYTAEVLKRIMACESTLQP
ncbi:7-cyano-7-deazaguanine synthase [Patescibacteria group bacterium]|nr:7-cyano-7-deazaguanine synthase [Patescibacteria group bacterium]